MKHELCRHHQISAWLSVSSVGARVARSRWQLVDEHPDLPLSLQVRDSDAVEARVQIRVAETGMIQVGPANHDSDCIGRTEY